MKRLTFLGLILCVPLASGAYCSRPSAPPKADTKPASKQRVWEFLVPDWHPVTAAQLERMAYVDQLQAIHDCRYLVANRVKVPQDFGKLRCNLIIKLGKGQHRGGDYWPAVLDALESIGIGTVKGDVTYERGDSKTDISTAIELREVR